jgi:hypothetical protein
MFKFDFVDFNAATPAAEKTQAPEQIRAHNEQAFREALEAFRRKDPDVVLVAFNAFGGDVESTAGPFPFRNPVDLRWLAAFDSLYSGDPRPSDVPEVSFWRSMDIYSSLTATESGSVRASLRRWASDATQSPPTSWEFRRT